MLTLAVNMVIDTDRNVTAGHQITNCCGPRVKHYKHHSRTFLASVHSFVDLKMKSTNGKREHFPIN